MTKKWENKEQILTRLRQPGAPSVPVISEETGIPVATLYSWVSRERRSRTPIPYPGGSIGMNERGKHCSPSTKLRLVSESLPLDGDALLAFCTSQGVTVEELFFC